MSAFNATKAVAVLMSAYRQDNLPEETIALYESKLGEINPQLMEAAIHRVLERHEFGFPAIAVIRRHAAELAGVLPPSAAEALAIVRLADVERPVCRRDGTYTYTEHEWHWPEDMSWTVRGLIRATLSKVGDPLDHDGKRQFGWDQGFQKAYEHEVATVEVDLSQAALPPSTRPPLALGE